jgi:hypothetical protein
MPAFDPTATFDVHCGNGFDAGFSPSHRRGRTDETITALASSKTLWGSASQMCRRRTDRAHRKQHINLTPREIKCRTAGYCSHCDFPRIETTAMTRFNSALFAAVAVASLPALATPARAAIEYPWCAQYGGEGADLNCGFVSREQCMETVRGAGGSCEPNLFYPRSASDTSQRKRKRQH